MNYKTSKKLDAVHDRLMSGEFECDEDALYDAIDAVGFTFFERLKVYDAVDQAISFAEWVIKETKKKNKFWLIDVDYDQVQFIPAKSEKDAVSLLEKLEEKFIHGKGAKK